MVTLYISSEKRSIDAKNSVIIVVFEVINLTEGLWASPHTGIKRRITCTSVTQVTIADSAPQSEKFQLKLK